MAASKVDRHTPPGVAAKTRWHEEEESDAATDDAVNQVFEFIGQLAWYPQHMSSSSCLRVFVASLMEVKVVGP